jgi:hypothetical protein
MTSRIGPMSLSPKHPTCAGDPPGASSRSVPHVSDDLLTTPYPAEGCSGTTSTAQPARPADVCAMLSDRCLERTAALNEPTYSRPCRSHWLRLLCDHICGAAASAWLSLLGANQTPRRTGRAIPVIETRIAPNIVTPPIIPGCRTARSECGFYNITNTVLFHTRKQKFA